MHVQPTEREDAGVHQTLIDVAPGELQQAQRRSVIAELPKAVRLQGDRQARLQSLTQLSKID